MPRALAYASLENHLTSDGDIRNFNRYINWGDYKHGSEDVGRSDVKNAILNRILHHTNAKRACCTGQKSVDVRIPIPNDVDLNAYSDKKDLYNNYQYFDVTGVEIPSDMCPSDHKGAGAPCDNFYAVYCANVLDMYVKQLKEVKGDKAQYNHDEFLRYKPECACFGDISVFSEIPETFPRKCVFSGCGEGGKSYLDSGSRDQNCSLNVCKSIINAANADVGGNMNIKSDIQQNCGASLPAKDKAALNDAANPPAPAPSPAPPAPAPAPATPAPAPTPATPAPAPASPAPAPATPAPAPATPAPAPAPGTSASGAAANAEAAARAEAIARAQAAQAANSSGSSNTIIYAAGGGLFLLCCCIVIIAIMMMRK